MSTRPVSLRRWSLPLGVLLAATTLTAAAVPWKWSGAFGGQTVSLLIIGDVQVHARRADPPSAFQHLRDTLQRADLVYANLEGVLVPSQGPDGDIPDKKGWTHPGTGAIQALKSANIRAVGVANNVAYGRANILKTIELLKANGIQPVGGGRDIAAAHLPVIVERKGVKIAFNVDAIPGPDLTRRLADEHNGTIRFVHKYINNPDAARASVGFFTTEEDVAALTDGIQAIQRSL